MGISRKSEGNLRGFLREFLNRVNEPGNPGKAAREWERRGGWNPKKGGKIALRANGLTPRKISISIVSVTTCILMIMVDQILAILTAHEKVHASIK